MGSIYKILILYRYQHVSTVSKACLSSSSLLKNKALNIYTLSCFSQIWIKYIIELNVFKKFKMTTTTRQSPNIGPSETNT